MTNASKLSTAAGLEPHAAKQLDVPTLIRFLEDRGHEAAQHTTKTPDVPQTKPFHRTDPLRAAKRTPTTKILKCGKANRRQPRHRVPEDDDVRDIWSETDYSEVRTLVITLRPTK